MNYYFTKLQHFRLLLFFCLSTLPLHGSLNFRYGEHIFHVFLPLSHKTVTNGMICISPARLHVYMLMMMIIVLVHYQFVLQKSLKSPDFLKRRCRSTRFVGRDERKSSSSV